MSTPSMTATICELVARVLERPSVEPSDRLEDLGCDELDRLLIAETVEKHFKLELVRFDEGEVAGWDRVIDVAESLVRIAESGGRKGT
jgi:Phosphopantetheine attachment site